MLASWAATWSCTKYTRELWPLLRLGDRRRRRRRRGRRKSVCVIKKDGNRSRWEQMRMISSAVKYNSRIRKIGSESRRECWMLMSQTGCIKRLSPSLSLPPSWDILASPKMSPSQEILVIDRSWYLNLIIATLSIGPAAFRQNDVQIVTPPANLLGGRMLARAPNADWPVKLSVSWQVWLSVPHGQESSAGWPDREQVHRSIG